MLSCAVSFDDSDCRPRDRVTAGSASPANSIRRLVKAAVFAVALLLVLPPIVLVVLEKRLSHSESVFLFFAQALAVVPGFLGQWLRTAYYFGTLDQCSWEVRFGFGTVFAHRGASIGRRVSTGAYCVIGHARIGEDVMIGSRVSIPSGKRQHLDEAGRLAQVTHFEHVHIGAHCWVGEGAILLADIGEGCIVSAGAVVGKTMPAGKMIGGNPARVVRDVERASDAPGA